MSAIEGFLLSPGTLIAAANAFLLLLGVVASLAGQPQAAQWLYLASALIGGAPIFKLAAGNILRDFDLTAGVMVSIAMIAALIVGEYSAAALVAFMMLVGEMLEDLTIARADNALKELASLVPDTVTLRREGEDVEVSIQAVRRETSSWCGLARASRWMAWCSAGTRRWTNQPLQASRYRWTRSPAMLCTPARSAQPGAWRSR